MLMISPDGQKRLVEIEGEPSLEILKQGIGGGLLETVPFFNHVIHKGQVIPNCVAFCDEEGKIKGLPYNSVATQEWDISLMTQGRSLGGRDYLVGTIAVIWGDDAFMEAL